MSLEKPTANKPRYAEEGELLNSERFLGSEIIPGATLEARENPVERERIVMVSYDGRRVYFLDGFLNQQLELVSAEESIELESSHKRPNRGAVWSLVAGKLEVVADEKHDSPDYSYPDITNIYKTTLVKLYPGTIVYRSGDRALFAPDDSVNYPKAVIPQKGEKYEYHHPDAGQIVATLSGSGRGSEMFFDAPISKEQAQKIIEKQIETTSRLLNSPNSFSEPKDGMRGFRITIGGRTTTAHDKESIEEVKKAINDFLEGDTRVRLTLNRGYGPSLSWEGGNIQYSFETMKFSDFKPVEAQQ